MPKYTNIEQVENYLLIDIDSGFESQVENWIDSVESFIDKYTGRNFKADTTASVKLYDGLKATDIFGTRGRKELIIDECVEIEELKIDDNIIDKKYYLTYPANSLPITRIVLKKDNGYVFTYGEQNISVKAKWGYSIEPPNDIVFVATILTAGIINYARGKNIVRSEAIGNYNVTYDDDIHWGDFEKAMMILKNYQKISI